MEAECERGRESLATHTHSPHAPPHPRLTLVLTAGAAMSNNYRETLGWQAQAQQFWSCLRLQISSKRRHSQTEVWALQKVAGSTAGGHRGKEEHADREMPEDTTEKSPESAREQGTKEAAAPPGDTLG